MEERLPDSVSGKILGKIKQEGIHPDAHWKFVVRKSLLWTGIVLAGLFAALSLSIIIFSILSVDQGLLAYAPKRLFSSSVLRSLPLLWVGSLLAFVALAVFEYRETGHGYRHRPLFVALVILLVVIVTGSAFHLLSIGRRSETALRKALPQYDRVARRRNELWRHPEDGFAAGTVTNATRSGFQLRTPDGDSLEVRIGDHTIVRVPGENIDDGRTVKVVGNQDPQGRIDAEEVLPALPSDLRGETSEQGIDDDQPLPSPAPPLGM